MEFNQFLNIIPKITSSLISGKISHDKMAPAERKKLMEAYNLEKNNPKKAAILMLIYPKNEKAHLVLILRNSYKGVHSAQIGFPGGKPEPEDDSLQATALRETFEEIGVASEKINIVRSLTEIYIPPSDFLVYPFLGFSTENLNFVPDSREVAGIIEWPIAELLNNKNCILKEMATSYSANIEIPVFKANNHFIWGATAMILCELKDIFTEIR